MKHARLELDYIGAPRRSPWLGLLLLAAALGIGGDLILRYRDARIELDRITATQGLLNTSRPSRPSDRPQPSARLDEQVKAAEAVVGQLTLPWATLIEVLEGATAKDVAVLNLQPEAQQHLLRITAEARNHSAMLEYLRALGATRALHDVHLVNHQVQLDDPQRPLQFSAQATFRVAGP